MKRILFSLVLVTIVAVWCKPSFADPARQTVVGAVPVSVDAIGEVGGVDMTGQGGGGRLNVGAGTDIFTFNNPVGTSAVDAITTDANDLTDVYFLGDSTVYGNTGAVGGRINEIHGGAANTRIDFLGNIWAVRVIFDADSTISLAAGKTADGGAAVTTTAGVNTGTLVLGGGSNWGGTGTSAVTGMKSVNVEGSGVSATITGAVGTNRFSLGSNTLNIGGAMTMTANGIIDTTLASATVYGNVVVTGASNLGTGLTVRVDVPSTVDVPVGTLFNIVVGAGTGALATVDPTNSLYTFSIEPVAAGGATIKVVTVPLRVPIDNPPADPIVPVAEPIATALEGAPPSPDITDIRAAINALSSAQDVVNAEAQLAPLAPALAAPLITFQGIRQFQDLWLARLDACSEFSKPWPDSSDSSCRGNEQSSAWWAKGVGYWGLRKDSGAYKGFETRILGTMIAYDVPLSDNTRGGLGFGYGRTDIDGKFFDTSTNFDTYRAMAYIGHEPGNWFVNAGLSFGWNEYTNKRHIQFTGVDRTANSKYSGQDYTAFASTGYHVLAKKFSVTPFGSLQYTRVNIGSYHEKGAGDVNLRVNSQGYDFYESGLGVKVARDFVYRGGTIIPDIHFKWLHDFSNPTLEQTARFNYQGTSTFVTHGLKISDDTYNVGIGLNLLQCTCRETDWSVEAGYDYEWRNDNYSANIATVRVTKRF